MKKKKHSDKHNLGLKKVVFGTLGFILGEKKPKSKIQEIDSLRLVYADKNKKFSD